MNEVGNLVAVDLHHVGRRAGQGVGHPLFPVRLHPDQVDVRIGGVEAVHELLGQVGLVDHEGHGDRAPGAFLTASRKQRGRPYHQQQGNHSPLE